jgi:hypothetical protein
MDEEVKVIGYCEECGSEINNDALVDEEGNYYCCIDCVLEHSKITRVEI